MVGFNPLRIVLMGLVLVLILFPAAPGTELKFTWPQILPTLIAPVLTPLVFFGLLLDLIMAPILLSQYQEAVRRRYRWVIITNIVLLFLLVLRWYPFFTE